MTKHALDRSVRAPGCRSFAGLAKIVFVLQLELVHDKFFDCSESFSSPNFVAHNVNKLTLLVVVPAGPVLKQELFQIVYLPKLVLHSL